MMLTIPCKEPRRLCLPIPACRFCHPPSDRVLPACPGSQPRANGPLSPGPAAGASAPRTCRARGQHEVRGPTRAPRGGAGRRRWRPWADPRALAAAPPRPVPSRPPSPRSPNGSSLSLRPSSRRRGRDARAGRGNPSVSPERAPLSRDLRLSPHAGRRQALARAVRFPRPSCCV